VDVGMASNGPLDGTSNRSSVEVEQILPRTEHDPRDFYASDSPVLDEYFDSDQDLYKSAEESLGRVDPEVQDGDQVESSIASVWFSYLTYTSQAN
jgi:hypothetical protein